MDKGTQIGPFVVSRLLGSGGMGSVYLAEHSMLKDLHAIKVLDPQLTQNPQIVARFVNEARAAARLRHRNLVRVHHIERVPGDGPWFMVLDYLEGSTLARFMASHAGPIAPPLIVHILAQVANGMQHVHDHKIVHRDLKPDNIFLIQHGEDRHFPVILDLGVAQLSSDDRVSPPVTRTGTLIGTPIYMAPEQLRGERVSPAADVFALGVIAYEMTTGGCFPYQYDEPRPAYFDLPPTEIYYRQRTAPPYDPRRRCPGLDGAWVQTLRAALELDPRARPTDIRALAVMFAEAVPATDDHPDGVTIAREVARELFQPRSPEPEARPSQPPEILGVAPEVSSQRPTVAEPITTLHGAASQSLSGMPRTRHWGVLAGGGAAALVMGAAAVVAVVHATTPADASRSDGPPAAAPLVVSPSVAPGPAPSGATVAPPPGPRSAGAGAGSASARGARSIATSGSGSSTTSGADPGSGAAPGPGSAATSGTAPATRSSAGSGSAGSSEPSPAQPVPGALARHAPSLPGPGHSPASPVAPRKTGELAIIVKPWALIWINGKSRGQTPFRENVPAGRYVVRLANDVVSQEETTTIVVNPDHTTTIQREW